MGKAGYYDRAHERLVVSLLRDADELREDAERLSLRIEDQQDALADLLNACLAALEPAATQPADPLAIQNAVASLFKPVGPDALEYNRAITDAINAINRTLGEIYAAPQPNTHPPFFLMGGEAGWVLCRMNGPYIMEQLDCASAFAPQPTADDVVRAVREAIAANPDRTPVYWPAAERAIRDAFAAGRK